MMAQIKKYRLWIAYSGIWILNFFLFWLVEIIMYYTMQSVIRMNQADNFLKTIYHLSSHPIQDLFVAFFAFVALFIFVSVRNVFSTLRHHQDFVVYVELLMALLIMKNVAFASNCILFIVMADALLYIEKPVQRNIALGIVMLIYLCSNYGFLSNLIPMISFTEYLSVYNSSTRAILSGIVTAMTSLVQIVFVVYMFLFIQVQMDETQRFAAMSNELKRLNIQLKGYANIREKMGETKERNRLAREIHDTLGHTLTGISVGLEASKVMVEKNLDATKKQLEILSESAKKGLQDVRRSVDKLKPDALDRYSLKEALDILIVDFQKMTNVTVLYLCHCPLVNLNADEEDFIYRIVQEGMTNAVRHGHADKIYVSIAQTENDILIVIEDNGQGCAHIEPGFGIHHLTERIELLQGKLRYYGRNGFELIAELPIRRRYEDD